MTVQQFVNSTLRLIGVLDSGETPSSSESDDAFAALNQLLASWSAGAAPVYQLSRDSIASTGAASYTLASRPARIRSVAVVSSGVSQDVQSATAEEWAGIRDTTRAGKFARRYLYDNGFPSATLRLWPVPATGGAIEVFSLKPLAQFASLSDAISLPPGYEQALRFAFASVLAPEYGSVLSAEIAQNAAEAKGAIASLNAANLGAPLPAPPVPAAPPVARTA